MKIKNGLLIALGFFILAIGIVGILVPVWPTTPFVLLAASCFSVSPTLRERILQIKFLREHVQNYKERTGLPKRNVAFSLSFLWSVLLASILTAKELWTVLALAAVGVAVTIHILCISHPNKTAPKRTKDTKPNPNMSTNSLGNRKKKGGNVVKTKMKTIVAKTVQLYGKKSVRHAELYDRGFALSLAGLIYLSISAFSTEGDLLRMAYFLVFCLLLVGLYGLATLYRLLFVQEILHQTSHEQIW